MRSSKDGPDADDSRADGVFAICSEPNGGLTLEDDTLISAYPNNERTDEYVRARDCVIRQTLVPSDIEDRMLGTKATEGPGGDQWPGWSAVWQYTVEDGLVCGSPANSAFHGKCPRSGLGIGGIVVSGTCHNRCSEGLLLFFAVDVDGYEDPAGARW